MTLIIQNLNLNSKLTICNILLLKRIFHVEVFHVGGALQGTGLSQGYFGCRGARYVMSDAAEPAPK